MGKKEGEGRVRDGGALAWAVVVNLRRGRRPAGTSDERRGDEVRRRSGACALDRGLEEHLSFGAGHARERGREGGCELVGWIGQGIPMRIFGSGKIPRWEETRGVAAAVEWKDGTLLPKFRVRV